MKPPKFTDDHRFSLPYVTSEEMGEGYLQRRFKEIAELQRQNAEERLRKTIQLRKATK